MKTRLALVLALVGGVAAAANAQQVNGTNVDFQFTWIEVTAGTTTPVANPNNQLEPGESALIALNIAMTPASGTAVTWNSAIGGSGSGTFRGLGSIFFDLNGTPNAQGTWTSRNVDLDWDLVGPGGYGTPANGGADLRSIQAGQFPITHNSTMLTNPINNIWTAVWTPDSYAARTVTFDTVNGTGNPTAFLAQVIVRDTAVNLPLIGTSASTSNDIVIPVVPAPSSLALLGLGGLVAARRRR